MKFGIPKLTQIYESNRHSFKNYIWGWSISNWSPIC